MKRVWNFFSSTGLTIILALLICIDAAWGSMVCMKNPAVFQALDRSVLFPWLFTAGVKNPGLILWIVVLVILIFLFAVNTVVCTLDRLYSIINNKRPWHAFLPHIVHIGFLVALLGHFLGSAYGFRSTGNMVLKGELAPVPLTVGLAVRLEDVSAGYTPSGELDSLKTTVTLIEGDKEVVTDTIEINDPLVYRGIAFYHVDHGSTPSGLILDVDGKKSSVRFGGSFTAPDGKQFHLGTLYADFAVDKAGVPYSRSERFRNPVQEIVSEDFERGYLSVSWPGMSVTLGGKTITLAGFETTPYAVLTINKDPGIWFVIAGSSILVLGMLLLLFSRGERWELVRQDPPD